MKEVIAVKDNLSIKEAAKLMASKKIGSLVIVNGDDIRGIVTEKDVTENISSTDKKISSFIKKDVVTIENNEELDRAALLMKKNKINHLPVVNNDGRLVGIISSRDLIENSEDLGDDFLFD